MLSGSNRVMSVDEIIAQFGGATAAAARLGLKRSTVAMWKVNGRVPLGRVPIVARALGVPSEIIWPDLAAEPRPQQEAA